MMSEITCTCPHCGKEFDQEIDPGDYYNDQD